MRKLLILFLLSGGFIIGCAGIPLDKSMGAREAGQSTVVLGGCSTNLELGWGHCLIERGGKLPTLEFVMLGPGEWAVGDCGLGLYRTGTTKGSDIIQVDLSDLTPQAERNGLCILKIETVERYKDPRAPSQLHSLSLSGGFFIEMVKPGYLPKPAKNVVAWCLQVERSSNGRTKLEPCRPH